MNKSYKTSLTARALLLAGLCLGNMTGAIAETMWFPLSGGAGMQVKIDVNSIVSAGNGLIKAWVMQSFDQQKITKGYPPVYYKSTLVLEVYNCVERTTDSLQEVLYSEELRGGEVVQTKTFPRDGLKFYDVVPGSVGEEQLEFACRWMKNKQSKPSPGRSSKTQ